jgi:hypothetical protein
MVQPRNSQSSAECLGRSVEARVGCVSSMQCLGKKTQSKADRKHRNPTDPINPSSARQSLHRRPCDEHSITLGISEYAQVQPAASAVVSLGRGLDISTSIDSKDSCTMTFLSRSNDPPYYRLVTSTVHTPSCRSLCGPGTYEIQPTYSSHLHRCLWVSGPAHGVRLERSSL